MRSLDGRTLFPLRPVCRRLALRFRLFDHDPACGLTLHDARLLTVEDEAAKTCGAG
jgi:hypothetical protein